MEKWLEKYADRLEEYASARIDKTCRDKAPLLLKLKHTRQVFAMARQIADDIPAHLRRSAILAALYHDVGRFEQYELYGTFKDANSCNHGALGVRIIKTEDFFKDEPPENKKLALTTVGLHNRFRLPANMNPDARLVCEVVRDADKLDILRVMREHLEGPGPYNPTVVLGLPDHPSLYSETVISEAMASRVASYGDLKSVNDFRVLLGTWLYDMSFPKSRNLFVSQGNAKKVLSALPQTGPYAPVREKLLADITGRENGI